MSFVRATSKKNLRTCWIFRSSRLFASKQSENTRFRSAAVKPFAFRSVVPIRPRRRVVELHRVPLDFAWLQRLHDDVAQRRFRCSVSCCK